MAYQRKTQINFNFVASTAASDEQIAEFNKSLTKLKSYSPGTPKKRHTGFEMIELDDWNGNPAAKTAKFLARIQAIRHVYESYPYSRDGVFTNGSNQEKTAQIRKRHETEIYWIQPTLLVISGPETDVSESAKWFRKKLQNSATIDPIIFDRRFLMWLIFKHRTGNPELVSGLEIDFISDARTTGKIDRMGKSTDVRKSTDVSRAIQTVLTILAGKEVSVLVCGFTIDKKWVATVEIQSLGKMRFYASLGTLSSVNSCMKRGISLMGVQRIITAYRNWQKLPPTEKYPPPDFFAQMAAEAEADGITIFSMKLQDLIKSYKKLRKGG